MNYSTFRIGALCVALAACAGGSTTQAQWQLVDDFESFTVDQEVNGVNGWVAPGNETTFRRAGVDYIDSGNQTLHVINDGASETLHIQKALPTAIPDTSTAATVYWRAFIPVFRTDDSQTTGNGPDWTVSVLDTVDADNAQGPAVLIDSNNNGVEGLLEVHNGPGGSFISIEPDIFKGVWHEFWGVVNNADDTWELYVKGGLFETQTLIEVDLQDPAPPGTTVPFRNPQGLLETFAMRVNAGQIATEHYFIDDIYMNLSEDLSSPATPGIVQGDFDQANGVDLNDFQILADNLFDSFTDIGLTTTVEAYAFGDFNFSGVVDFEDFILFREAYAEANPSAALLTAADLFNAAGVPEPASVVLLLAGSIACVRGRRRV